MVNLTIKDQCRELSESRIYIKAIQMIVKVGSLSPMSRNYKSLVCSFMFFRSRFVGFVSKRIQTRMLLDEYIAFALFYQYFYLLA